MIDAIRKMLGLCSHKWKIMKTVDLYESSNSKMPFAIEYHQQCENCGNLKKVRM